MLQTQGRLTDDRSRNLDGDVIHDCQTDFGQAGSVTDPRRAGSGGKDRTCSATHKAASQGPVMTATILQFALLPKLPKGERPKRTDADRLLEMEGPMAGKLT